MAAASKTESKSTSSANAHSEQVADQVAEETRARLSNGNREQPTAGAAGGAERGGPDLDKAERRAPPDADGEPVEGSH